MVNTNTETGTIAGRRPKAATTSGASGMTYIPNTDADRAKMLAAIGVESVERLFDDIPAACRNPELKLPAALSEPELVAELRGLAARNLDVEGRPCFLGAGAYRHFVPSVVGHVLSRSEFYTAYTPYQPEISQGTLQGLYEYQSLICDLTGLDVSNAGMYDGSTALAEAALMAVRVTGKRRIGLASQIHPEYEAVLRTYTESQNIQVTHLDGREPSAADGLACLVVQNPNFYGCLEDVAAVARTAHAIGALAVVLFDPISLGLLQSPGAAGADIAVAEGQPLGVGLAFGGPYLGIFAVRQQYVRQMPSRIAGQTVDVKGQRGFVLTLQTREQHIRRENATSNICTNETLLAFAATVYLAALGKQGLRRVAELCYHKAQYAATQIAMIPGFALAFDRPFFKELVVRCPIPPADVNRRLLAEGIVGGLDVADRIERGLLLCVTEMNTRTEIDALVEALRRMAEGRVG